MLKKRLLVLAVMFCSLAFVASESTSAESWCSCAATSCTECNASCDPDPGTSAEDVWAAAQSCCRQAWKDTGPGMACPPSGVNQ